MSYTITLRCGCVVYVSCHPDTQIAHTRVIEARGAECSERRHERGVRLTVDQTTTGVRETRPRDVRVRRGD
jgi:hypothetical protein